MRPRDGKKSAFYKAEDAALEYHNQKHFPTLAHVEDYVRKTVLRDKWFKRTFGTRSVLVKPSERKAHSSGNVGWIKIAKEHYIEYIVLHEIAHGIAPLTGWAAGDPRQQVSHGREYAHTYLLLVQHFMGAEAAKKLRAAYRKHKIKYTAPRKISDEQKDKLRRRLELYRIGLTGSDAADVIEQDAAKISPEIDIALARAQG